MNLLHHQDVPALSPGLTSSIGGLWPPEKASFQRIKGIYTCHIIRNREELEPVLQELEHLRETYFQGNEVTRISLRAIVARNVLSRDIGELKTYVEAIIPLDGIRTCLDNTCMVYFGTNHSTRQSSLEELDRYREQLSEILALPVRTCSDMIQRVYSRGYSLETLCYTSGKISEESTDQIASLYRRFGWTREDVLTILNHPHNLIGIAKNKEEIVSAGIAEIACIPLGDEWLRIVEITEAATAAGSERSGLYTAVSACLLQEIATRSRQLTLLDGEVDYVFGECNSNALGVLTTAHVQGRTFSLEIARQFGFPESGVLSQSVPIAGAHRTTPYNDLFPSFLNRASLYRLYG